MNSKLQKFFVSIILFCSPFIGIFSTILGIQNTRNYLKFYPFLILTFILGIGIGLFISLKFKSFIIKSIKRDGTENQRYKGIILFLSFMFAGMTLYSGSLINTVCSKLKTQNLYSVVDKYKYETTKRYDHSKFYIYVDLSGEIFELSTSPDYWQCVAVGNKIRLNVYESSIGFDYIIITDENKQIQ